VKKGARLTQANREPGDTPFIGATDTNNGLTNRIDADPRHPANLITVVYNGNNVAESFYQPDAFWCSDDVNVLYPKPKSDLDPETALFVATVLRREKYRFSYGRKWNKARMEKSVVKLPASNGKPDWAFMRDYVRGLPFSADLTLPVARKKEPAES
jgi:Type I restriction modification DNA specificity domain